MIDVGFNFKKGCVWPLDVLYTRFEIRDINLRMVDDWYACLGIRKGCLRWLDVLYKHFDIRKWFVTMVDALYTPFNIRKSYFGFGDVLFYIRKSCVLMLDVF